MAKASKAKKHCAICHSLEQIEEEEAEGVCDKCDEFLATELSCWCLYCGLVEYSNYTTICVLCAKAYGLS